MKRRFVKVARMRIEDVAVGDVVNRAPESEVGWFEVAEVMVLFNGELQLSDRTTLITISGPLFTIVGVQFVSVAEIPEQPPSPLPPMDVDDMSDQPSNADGAEAAPLVPASLAG